jgi:ABC-type bacteriocin/lantibiotic exporter with double-glycine peptidase domain
MQGIYDVDLIGRYQGFRREAPSVAGQLKRNALVLLRTCVVCLGIAALLWWLDAPLAAGMALGFLVATLVLTIGNYVRTRDVWPLVERITDWSEVDRVSAETVGAIRSR